MRAEGGVFVGRLSLEGCTLCGVGSLTDSSNFRFAKELGGGCEYARVGVFVSRLFEGDMGPIDLRGEEPVCVFFGERPFGRGNLIFRSLSVGSGIVPAWCLAIAVEAACRALWEELRLLTVTNLHRNVFCVGAICSAVDAIYFWR